ncbi:hemagglutinin repeat-containing protein [Rhizobium sp. YTU87027]|uniref:hemagglutinin repeat-containing protein n=1 Tax=Rhizobium sp. YTU87027 TaxID=3417741 RepID=UPI003D68077E
MTSTTSTSGGASFGTSAGVGIKGVSGGLTGSASASAGKSNADGTTQVNSHVNGTGDVTLESGNDTRLAGAVVSGDTVTANVGGDLTILSVPDTGASSNHSVSGGFSLGGGQLLSGVQIGGGSGSGETNWITEQSGLVSTGTMDIIVGGNTHLGAGKIISESGDLILDTGTLTYDNFDGQKNYEGFSVELGIDLSSGKDENGNSTTNHTLEGSYQLDDTRQTVRATVGPGDIVIRDQQQQAALEQDGTSTRPLDELNRDPDKAYEITRDKHVELEVYLSTNSLKAVVEAGKTIAEAVSAAIDRMVNDGKLSLPDSDSVKKLLAYEDDPTVRAALMSCGQQSGDAGFNLFDWLVTPAHAASSCLIPTPGGTVAVTPQGALTCLASFESMVAVATTIAKRAATPTIAGAIFLLLDPTSAGASVDHTQTLADGTTIRMTGQQDELSRHVVVTLPTGQQVSLVLVTTDNGGYELMSGKVAGANMPASMLGDVAGQLSSGGMLVVYNEKTDTGGDQADDGRLTNPTKGESKVWQELDNAGNGRKKSGTGSKTRYYEWDYTHNDIEVYDNKGRHLGSADPTTGEIYKPPVPGRKIKL